MKQKFTPTLLAAVVAGALSSPAMADVIISQYVEGGSNNKAIEIANTGDSAISLDGYELAKSTNGGGEWGSKLSLSGQVLEAQSVLVIAHSSASDDIKAVADIINGGVTGFNGNDPMAILKDGAVHDVIGNMGGGSFATDVTLVRNSDAMTPSSTYDASQWSSLPKDSIEGLGVLDGGTAPEPFACTQDGAQPTFTSIQEIQGEGDTSPC